MIMFAVLRMPASCSDDCWKIGPTFLRACPEQAAVVDNGDGTYALQFRLSLAGTWELAAAVNGGAVPCPAAAAIPAEHGRLTAADCEIEGVEGAVACGTSDPIFIQATTWSFCIKWMCTKMNCTCSPLGRY
jgi:hypothetical protein